MDKPPPGLQSEPARRHLLTVAMEDYFQVGAFNRLIQRGQWYRFENRLESSTRKTLALLDELGVRATFFVLGWVADQLPELVRAVAGQGHEIASKGYYHRGIGGMTPGEFREDLARAREALERASGRRVIGYRVADEWFTLRDLWALDVLAEEGYEYDSSIGPVGRRFASEPWRRFTHPHHFGDRVLWEFPISAVSLLGWMLPIAGGNYFRQLPHALVSRAVARWHRRYTAPLVLYFHTWELDPDQPKIQAASWLSRVRQYRHLDRMPGILRHYLERYALSPAADYLGISTTPAPAVRTPAPLPPAVPAAGPPRRRGVPVTIVVPCYNEELILPYLANTLAMVRGQLGRRYDLRLILVDDCSTDGTRESLERIFGNRAGVRILRHDRNQGVAAAILTGIAAADTDIVCSIDCDCTYDPLELGRMIPLLDPATDLVTASPYHPRGEVRNVPGWRLFMSRSLSAAYRVVLGRQLYTWTSCVRVYRREAVLPVRLRSSGFLGVAELLGTMVLAGSRVVEHPAVLEVRMLGRSKMKVLRTVAGHVRLLAWFAWARLRGRPARPPQIGPLPTRPSPPAGTPARVA